MRDMELLVTHALVVGSPLADDCTRSRYLDLLPRIFRADASAGSASGNGEAASFIGRFLIGFEYLFEQLEQRQTDIACYFEPATCPQRFLPWLLGWFGIAPAEGPCPTELDEARQRQLLHEAYRLCAQRGTAVGLMCLLDIVTGYRTIVIGGEGLFHFRVVLEPNAAPNSDDSGVGDIDLDWVRAWVDAYKPAHATYDVEVRL